MLSFFKRKTPQYPSESRWTIYTGMRDDKPMLVRKNESAIELLGHRDYRLRVGIAVPLSSPDERGFPGEAEGRQLQKIEDLLIAKLESDQGALQVLAITTAGMREFVFYARESGFSQIIFDALQREVTTHELQAYSAIDDSWDLYRQFA